MNEDIRFIASQLSKPKASVNVFDLLKLRPYIESFLNTSWLDRKLEEYEEWASKNSDPILQTQLLHRPSGFNMLVASIRAARYWEGIYKKDSSFKPPAGAKRLLNIACSLAVLELQSGNLLNTEARDHLQWRLQNAGELWGIIHELNTFSLFIRQGAKVQPHFLKRANPEELTAQWHGADIPVQCKAKRPGSGRLISQDIFTELAGSIARDARSKGKRLIVRIGSTGRIREEDIDFLRHQVATGTGSSIGPALITNKGRTFTVRSQPLLGQFTTQTIGQYLSKFSFHVGMVIGEPAIHGNAYNAVAVVGIDANFSEKPWNSLQNSIKKGANQLKGGPLGILAIHYADPMSDFETLRPGPMPLVNYIGHLLNRRQSVGAVMLSSEPELQIPKATGKIRTFIYYRKPWPFSNDFLLDNQSILDEDKTV